MSTATGSLNQLPVCCAGISNDSPASTQPTSEKPVDEDNSHSALVDECMYDLGEE